MHAFSTTVQAHYTLTIDDVDFVDGEITAYLNRLEKDVVIPDNYCAMYIQVARN